MDIIALTQDNIDEAIKKATDVLRQGGLVVVPSDTVYGLSVDASNSQAVKKLIDFKSRPAGKPISVFVNSLPDAEKVVKIDKNLKETLASILPGCFTVVLASKKVLDKRLESEKRALGVRVIDHPFINKLTSSLSTPITATSANLSGRPPHYSIDSLLNSLSKRKREMIDLIVDFGKLPRNKPSTVIDLTGDEVAVLRRGDTEFNNGSEIISSSEDETRLSAQNLFKKWANGLADKALVIILQGDLGAGKTQFVKGVGEYFGIEKIISPTFVIYYEYKISRKPFFYLYHVDLYNVSEKSEFNHLGFEKMLKPGNIVCIEWGEKSSQINDLLLRTSTVIPIKIDYIDEKKRRIKIGKY